MPKREDFVSGGAKSVATSPGEVKHHPQPNEGYEATNADGIARRSGEIGVNNVQTNISSAASRQSPSPRPSATTPDSCDDEELGYKIYRTWLRMVRPFVNSIDEVSSSSPSSSTCESLHRAANRQSNIMGGGCGGGISSGKSVGLGTPTIAPLLDGDIPSKARSRANLTGQSPSLGPSATTPDSSDDEELGDWIYRTWRRTVRTFANSIDGVSSSSPSSSTCESLHRAVTLQ